MQLAQDALAADNLLGLLGNRFPVTSCVLRLPQLRVVDDYGELRLRHLREVVHVSGLLDDEAHGVAEHDGRVDASFANFEDDGVEHLQIVR